MDTHVPRSRRLGQHPEDDGPFAGIPPHLQPQLSDWLQHMLEQMPDIWCLHWALRMRIAASEDPAWDLFNAARQEAEKGSDGKTWDLVEAILREGDIRSDVTGDIYPAERNRDEIRTMLELANSVYMVSDDGLIVERVGDEASETYAQAVAVDDPISEHLRKAWGHAYGRTPDASDAWDHAIKAMEAMLGPIVAATDPKATLGKIKGQLGSSNEAEKFEGAYLASEPGPNGKGERVWSHSAKYVVPFLDVIWPNPDRHESGSQNPKPTLADARAVVALTAALVQTHRDSPRGLVHEKS